MTTLRDDDGRLIAVVDAVVQQAAARGGKHLVCHAGCTPCCFGPFAITQLDAWRLREGLAHLATVEPERAEAVRRRADADARQQARAFPPGRVGTFETEAEEETFYETFASAPCPALDPDSGACLVYQWRPIACRTYGPPIRIAGDDLPHCPLCFTQARDVERATARVTLDVEALETPLTETVERETGRRGMTTVTFAIVQT